jgi:hypothetical protein
MLLQERLEIAKTTINPIDCYAAAFYLTGIIDEERFLTCNEISRYLANLSVINHPEIGCLVHFWNGSFGHIGVITHLNPIRITDRHGIQGEIRENQLLPDVMLEYGGLDILTLYLTPKPI